jgi:autotransporter translocation and assembly factor TamB
MRRALRIALRALLGLALAVVFVLIGALISLQFKPVRAFIRDKVSAAVRGSLQGELYVADVRMPSFERIELSGVTLKDRRGVEVVALPSALIELQLRPLLAGRLVIERVEVDHLYVDLADLGDSAGLLSVFASAEPKPPDPTAGMSPIPVDVRRLCISEGVLELQPQAARRLRLRHIHTCVALGVARSLEVAIQTLRAELSQNEQPVLELTAPEQIAALSSLGVPAAEVGPLRSALSGKLRFHTQQDMAFDARLALRGASAQTLDALGIDSSFLRADARVDADIHLSAAARRIAYRLEVRAPESVVHAWGELDAQRVLWTHLTSEPLELARLAHVELPRFAFELDAKLDLSAPDDLDAQLELLRGRYGELVLPQTSLRVHRSRDGTLTLRSLEARYAGALLIASGRLAADGGIEAEAKLSAPDLSALPLPAAAAGLSGALTTHLQVRRSARGNIDVGVELKLRSLELQANRAAAIALSLRATGAPQRPVLQASLTGRELNVAGEHVGELEVKLDGGPDRYHVAGRADVGRLALDGWLAEQPPRWEGGLTLTTDLGKGPIAVELPLARFTPGKELALHQLRAHYLDASLFADGQVGLGKRRSRLRFGVVVPDLARLLRTFAQPELPGRVELAGDLRGAIERPALQARLNYSNGAKLLGQSSQAQLDAVVDLARATAHAQLGASAGEARAHAELDSKWRREQPLPAAMKAAEHALDVDFSGVSLAALMQPSDPDLRAKFDGLLGGHFSARGNPNQLQLDTRLEAKRLRAVADSASLDVVVSGQYRDAKLSVELKAGDRAGQLAELGFADELPLERMIANPGDPRDLVSQTRWQAHANLAERRVRELPIVSGLGVPAEYAPVRVASVVHLDHEPGAEPVGELESRLRWEPVQVAAQSGTCSALAHGTLTLTGQLRDGALGLRVEGGTTSQKAIELKTRMQVTLAELLAGTPRNLGPLSFETHVHELDLSTLPIACERGKGVVSASVAARDVFDKRAKLEFAADAKGLVWDGSAPLGVQANAHAAGDALQVAAQLRNGSGQLQLDGRLPIDLRVADPALLFNRTGPVALKARFAHVAAAQLVAFVPDVKRVSGVVEGVIGVAGTLQAPITDGSLQLQDLSFTLPRLGQRFSHLNLKAALAGRRVRISEGQVRDLDGRATFDAQLTLPSADAWDGELNLSVHNFPVRTNGVMTGRTDASVHVETRGTAAKTDVSVQLSQVAVSLTSNELAQVQTLEPHPEIVFSDAAPAKVAVVEDAHNAMRATIKIRTSEPLWVRRDDFAVQMTTDLTLALGGETPELTGIVGLQRGYISLLGQNFEIKRGRVVMTGGTNVDPQLELTATHSAADGTVVQVDVTGFVTHPVMSFTINTKSVDAQQAMLAIMGFDKQNSGSGGSMQSQMASAAVGMTTGLLSLGARREFGAWVPMLSFERGEQTRLRVGMEADKLIPRFMRRFVRGAYVEGVWAGENKATPGSPAAEPSVSATANTSSGGGVLIELLLPEDLVWAGQYGPGTVWSLDLDWRP